jgi:flagellar hook capping protein FlgD
MVGAFGDDDVAINGGAAYAYRLLVNQPPVCEGGALPDATEGQAYTAVISASDPDTANTLTYELVEGPSWLAVSSMTDSTVTLKGIPAEADTTASAGVEIHVLDGIDTVKAIFTLAVLDTSYAPVADEEASSLTPGLVSHAWTDTLHASDADGSDRGLLTWEIVDNGGLVGLSLSDSVLSHPAFVADDTLTAFTVVVRIVDLAGAADTLTLELDVIWPVGVGTMHPTVTALLPNTPNPFNPSTTIGFSLADGGPVSLCIYNALGQQVRMLVNSHTTAGYHTVTWNGYDDRGKAVASGVYLYRLVVGGDGPTATKGGKVMVRRMSLVR